MNNITLFLLVTICVVYIILSYIGSKANFIKNNICFENLKKLCENNMKYYNSLVIMLTLCISIVYYLAAYNNYICLYDNGVNEIDAITRIKNLI